jgi:hypothetical protein
VGHTALNEMEDKERYVGEDLEGRGRDRFQNTMPPFTWSVWEKQGKPQS